MAPPRLIGVIADTHGLLRPQALERLAGSDLIVHAGDIGKQVVLDGLEALAPVRAIRGNVDRDVWAQRYPERDTFELDGCRIHVVHDRKTLDIDPAAEGIDLVISGHSHAPRCERTDGVLYLNPGSAGPRRFKLPVAVAIVRVQDGRLDARIHPLEHRTDAEPQFGVGDASFRAAGGESGVEALVDDFYRLMDELPEAATVRAMHPQDLSASRDKLARFLCGWLGGPRRYAEKYGPINIPNAHAHLAIDAAARDEWLLCMDRAIARQPFSAGFADYLRRQFRVPADRVVNRTL